MPDTPPRDWVAKHHVFVVDDDVSVLTAMKRLLWSAGFDVETFTSGRAFLDAVSPDTLGCVVVDVQMPGMSGLQLQEQMTTADYRLSVVFLTARPNAADRRRALRGGAIHYLEKPVSADVLFACVKAVRPPT